MAAHYFLSAVPPRRSGSMAAPTDRSPRKLHKERSRTRIKEITNETRYQKPRVTTPLCPPLQPPPLHPHCPNFPPPVEPLSRLARTAGLSSASRSPTRHFCLPLFATSLTLAHRGLLVFPLATVLEEVLSRLVSTTIVLRVAPPAVVVRSVIRALQVHAHEGMPGLELVEPRGRSLGRGRVGLAFHPEDVPIVEPSPLTPRPGFRPLLLRCPAPQVGQGDWWHGPT